MNANTKQDGNLTNRETHSAIRGFIRLHLGDVPESEREAMVDRVLARAIERQKAGKGAA